MYIHQRDDWWQFQYDKDAVMNKLGAVRARQGMMLGRMQSLGFDFQEEAMLATMSLELVRSCEIEGEALNLTEVRSSIARRLGINSAGMVPVSRYVDGVVCWMPPNITMHHFRMSVFSDGTMFCFQPDAADCSQ